MKDSTAAEKTQGEVNDVKWWKIRLPLGNMGKLVWLGLCFFMLFSPFQATQILVSSIYSNVGLLSLCLLYVSYTISSFFAPLFVEALGLNVSMFFASLLYALWIGCSASGISWLFVLISALNGFGGGPIWVSQGAYVQRIAGPTNLGRYNGIFFALFFSSNIVGNLITGTLFFTLPQDSGDSTDSGEPKQSGQSLPKSTALVLWVMFAVSCVAVILYLLLPPVPSPKQTDFKKRVIKALSYFKDKRTLFLMPYFLNSGTSVAFAWGSFPRLMELKWVPYVTVVYGAALFIASMSSGALFDRFGWRPILVLHLISVCIAYALTVIAYHFKEIGIFFAASFFLGLVEAFTINLCSSLVIKVYNEEAANGFSMFRFFSGLGIALIFVIAIGLVWYWLLMLLGIICIISAIVLSVFMIHVYEKQ